jgi:hypothetical protein
MENFPVHFFSQIADAKVYKKIKASIFQRIYFIGNSRLVKFLQIAM